jgi:transposase-like protein
VDNKLINKQLITQHFSLLNIGKVNQKKFYAYEVYGLFEVDGFVFSEVVDPKLIKNIFNSSGSSVSSESHIHEGFRHKYDALLFGMFPKLVFLNYQHNAISQQSTSIFNIESFWSFCCRRLQKFNGISRHFYFHLKECEWRWKKEDDQLVQHLHELKKKSA